eukprot:TRINITY_DN7048_c0_g1_i1.p1 TRINITY_DN7048_c0_g1~~TRINITY_DN7048_c0_g1_i1.p1  ORF type:complete len:106 (-),score=3.92 TRINITY_DN7048_c0_g1_i1:683-1000(-)
MRNSQSHIQSQLSETLSIISKHDFPMQWPTLLAKLVSALHTSTTYMVINGILRTVNSAMVEAAMKSKECAFFESFLSISSEVQETFASFNPDVSGTYLVFSMFII